MAITASAKARSFDDVSPMPPSSCINAGDGDHARVRLQDSVPPTGARLRRRRDAGGRAIANSQPGAGQEPITPILAVPAQDTRRLALGERLFSDRRLSHDNTRSCSSCHDIRTNGASSNAHDLTPEGRPLAAQYPDDLQCSPELSPKLGREFSRARKPGRACARRSRNRRVECGRSRSQAARRPRNGAAIPRRVREGTRRCRPSGCDRDLRALARHAGKPLRPLACGRRRRDHARGAQRLSAVQVAWLRLCHQGVNVGGNLFQRHGIFHPIGSPEPALVRVPSLRNVATTPPYFHDGSTPTLSEAVKTMGSAQLDRVLTDQQIAAIVASSTR